MGRRSELRAKVGDITTRGLIAYRSGWEAYTPGIDPNEVKSAITKAGGVHLAEVEQLAYGAMLPATWWAQWSRGWRDAEQGKTIIGAAGDSHVV